jgi:hypothetical protein
MVGLFIEDGACGRHQRRRRSACRRPIASRLLSLAAREGYPANRPLAAPDRVWTRLSWPKKLTAIGVVTSTVSLVVAAAILVAFDHQRQTPPGA